MRLDPEPETAVDFLGAPNLAEIAGLGPDCALTDFVTGSVESLVAFRVATRSLGIRAPSLQCYHKFYVSRDLAG